MSECGTNLAELRQAENFTDKVRYRGSLITKRCDCRNSNGLDPVCKCTKVKEPAPKNRVTRSQASVSEAPPQPRRIFAQTTPDPVPHFKSTAPPVGVNLNGDSIPIPARYKYRKPFPVVPDPNSQLHWMVRPETPPRPGRNQRNYHKFEEAVPHHRRTHMLAGAGENMGRQNPMAGTAQPQQQLQAENTNNVHGSESNVGNHRAEPSVPNGNPSQKANYMYKAFRGYDYDQINCQPQQVNDAVRAAPPTQEPVQAQVATSHASQEQAPVSHPTQEPQSHPVPAVHPVQTQAHVAQPYQEPQSNPVPAANPVQAQAPMSHSTHGSQSHAMQASHPVTAQTHVAHPTQETQCHPEPTVHTVQAPVYQGSHSQSHAMQAPHLVQTQTPVSHSVEPIAPHQKAHVATSQRVQEPLQLSHPYHESEPVPVSVPANVATLRHVPQSVPTPAQERPVTPIPARDNFAQELDALRAREGAATPKMTGPSHVSHPQTELRDLPSCPDRFYPSAHC